MKHKVLLKIVVVIVVVLVVLVVAIQLFGGAAVKVGVEKAGSKAMKVPVSVDNISFSLFGGTVGINDLTVGNPDGYKIKNLLELGDLHVKADIKSFLSDTARIEYIKLDNMTVSIEQKGLTNNLQEVLKALPKSEKTEPESTEQAESTEKNLQIDTLEITGVKVKARLIPLPGEGENAVELTLAPIKMTDLGSNDKLSMAKLTGKILTAVAMGIAESGAGLLPEGLVGGITDTLGQQGAAVVETTKELLDKSKDIGGDAIKSGKDIGEGVGDALKGIFNNKDK
jgi:hypothetical protein